MVLYIGNLSQGAKHKSFDILLKAWAEVCAENEDILLSIAGGGDVRPWKQMASDLGCGESVRFEGHVKDISRLLAKAALFVLPSRGEGISNALLEAQSCGIPAVVTDIPGNTEVVLHGETGIVVPVDDVSGLSEAILKLMADDDTRERMGAKARQHIIEKYSIRSVVDRVCNVYEEMSTGRASRSLV
ncbi:MAG: glycosyltransferase family 1 protein [Candidatus Electrothrix sp. ATG2]|nr:glycosyltransferase family 1 protein [Candidatus Electrothrix sp. ATG2]